MQLIKRMLDKKEKYLLIREQYLAYEKRRQRLFLTVLILPVIYLLIDSLLIQEIAFNNFSIKNINVLKLLIPGLSVSLIFYLFVLTDYLGKLLQKSYLALTDTEDFLEAQKKEPFIKYFEPMNLIGEILRSIRAGSCLGLFGSIIVYFPLLIFLILYPVVFLFMSSYRNFKFINTDLKWIAIGTLSFTAWVMIAIIIFLLSISRKVRKLTSNKIK